MSTAIAIPSLKTGDDKEVAEKFKQLFHDAQNGQRRVVAFGLYAAQIKFCSLKHTQFGNWVRGTFADVGISYRAVRAQMQLASSALKAVGVKSIKNFVRSKMAEALPFSHCGEFLLLPDSKIPESIKPLREKLFSLIDGKSAKQLFTEFKQLDDDEDDENPKPKRGRLKGQGGASKEQRAAAAAAEEKARITEIELTAKDFGKWIDHNCDAQGLGKISDRAFDNLCEKAELLWQFCRQLKAARKGGAK
jgi:hypothetical protein